MTGDGTKAGSLMKKLQLIETADTKREREVQGWIDALQAAETAAAAVPGAKPLHYQVSYRVKGVGSKSKGSADQRRSTLVRLVESITSNEKHLSTSTWIVRLHIIDAGRIADLLLPPLASFDFLSVAQISPRNRATRGDAKLD